jgi:ABC-type branched-subunit amino acid transport system permease subunit
MTLGMSRSGLIAFGAVAIVLLFVVPATVAPFRLLDLSLYAIMAILAMSLGFVWGFGGILSFGQSLFYGLGGYTYAILVLNFGDSTLPAIAAIALPALFAWMLGYFMFWGRVSDVYLSVITLTVSLIFFMLINSMSGSAFRIGVVPIGGYNGIPGIPPINVPGDPARALDTDAMYYLGVVLALAVYLGLRVLLATRFGRVLRSIRENETRTELLGYDTRKFKLLAYIVGAGLAGMAGMLYATWGGLINPDAFSMAFAAQIIVWVMLGGLGTLVGPMVGAIVIQTLILWLGRVRIADANMVLGAIFIVFVLLVPGGIVPKLRDLAKLAARRPAAPKATVAKMVSEGDRS